MTESYNRIQGSHENGAIEIVNGMRRYLKWNREELEAHYKILYNVMTF